MNSIKNTDMLNGPLAKKIILFTLPIALSSAIQQLFNAADTAVVGLCDNADALAAVGTNTETVALIVTVSSGLSLGTNVLVASRIGKKRSRYSVRRRRIRFTCRCYRGYRLCRMSAVCRAAFGAY